MTSGALLGEHEKVTEAAHVLGAVQGLHDETQGSELEHVFHY
jgi:hypothetical protein